MPVLSVQVPWTTPLQFPTSFQRVPVRSLRDHLYLYVIWLCSRHFFLLPTNCTEKNVVILFSYIHNWTSRKLSVERRKRCLKYSQSPRICMTTLLPLEMLAIPCPNPNHFEVQSSFSNNPRFWNPSWRWFSLSTSKYNHLFAHVGVCGTSYLCQAL